MENTSFKNFYDNNGYVIDLGWEINPGSQYLLTTNIDINNDIFGDNNPMLKRTTGGLPDFPFVINNILEITEGYYSQGNGDDGSSPDYYYYFYDWEVSYSRTCDSQEGTINVIVGTVDLNENTSDKSLLKITDLLGREIKNAVFGIEVYDDGTVDKRFILK